MIVITFRSVNNTTGSIVTNILRDKHMRKLEINITQAPVCFPPTKAKRKKERVTFKWKLKWN